MKKKLTLTEAFGVYGARLRNVRWACSAIAAGPGSHYRRARLLPQPLFYPLINQHSANAKADQRSLYFSTTKAPSLFEISTTAHQH